jgi:hypothetical protein
MSIQRSKFTDQQMSNLYVNGTSSYPPAAVIDGGAQVKGAMIESYESVTADGTARTVSLNKCHSLVALSASTTITLADVATARQTDQIGLTKTITIISASAGTATVSMTTVVGGSVSWTATAAGQSISLVWTGATGWAIVGSTGGTLA